MSNLESKSRLSERETRQRILFFIAPRRIRQSMVFIEATGVLCVLAGGYALARPLSIRNYPNANQWEANPEKAKQEQRAYAALAAFSLILGGLALIVLGLLGILS